MQKFILITLYAFLIIVVFAAIITLSGIVKNLFFVQNPDSKILTWLIS